MAFTEWVIEGVELVNCNCAPGCPCQFSSPPTHGHCRALHFVQIERGHHGEVALDGLRWGMLLAWPRAIHFGDGTLQPIIEARADARQRAALETIALGGDTDPGTLIWQVFSTTVTTVLPTLFRPIDLAIEVEHRTASVHIPGLVEGRIEPIKNVVTGEPQRVRVALPAGFEFREAEFASGVTRAIGTIPLDFSTTHAHLARVRWGTHGVLN